MTAINLDNTNLLIELHGLEGVEDGKGKIDDFISNQEEQMQCQQGILQELFHKFVCL